MGAKPPASPPADHHDERAASKRAAGEWAAGLIQAGMVVGLGTGTTAIFALRRLADRLHAGELTDVVGIPTSTGVEAQARELGIPLTDLATHPEIDLTIDGADEIDPDHNLIKGGGGALLREKIIAQASRREVIVADPTKCSPVLGTRHRLPVEVLDFGWRPAVLHIESLGGTVSVRKGSDRVPYRTDQGNIILDVDFGPITDPQGLAAALLARAGVVAVGLFCGLVSDVIVGTPTGVEHRTTATSA